MWSGLAARRPRGLSTHVRRMLCLPVDVFRFVAVGYNDVSFNVVFAGFSDVVMGGSGCESVVCSGVGSSAWVRGGVNVWVSVGGGVFVGGELLGM